jgi:hypothetical protein
MRRSTLFSRLTGLSDSEEEPEPQKQNEQALPSSHGAGGAAFAETVPAPEESKPGSEDLSHEETLPPLPPGWRFVPDTAPAGRVSEPTVYFGSPRCLRELGDRAAQWQADEAEAARAEQSKADHSVAEEEDTSVGKKRKLSIQLSTNPDWVPARPQGPMWHKPDTGWYFQAPDRRPPRTRDLPALLSDKTGVLKMSWDVASDL